MNVVRFVNMVNDLGLLVICGWPCFFPVRCDMPLFIFFLKLDLLVGAIVLRLYKKSYAINIFKILSQNVNLILSVIIFDTVIT